MLATLSYDDLKENCRRIGLANEDLQFCLDNLIEENEELACTNYMLKNTIIELIGANKKVKISQRVSEIMKKIWTSRMDWKAKTQKIFKSSRENEKLKIVEILIEGKKNPVLEEVKSIDTSKSYSMTISEEISMPKSSRQVKKSETEPAQIILSKKHRTRKRERKSLEENN